MSNMEDTLTFRLFARPSFIEGLARTMDFGCSLQAYNESPTTLEADLIALRGDWRMVGKDIEQSLEKYGQEQTQTSPAATK